MCSSKKSHHEPMNSCWGHHLLSQLEAIGAENDMNVVIAF